VKRRTLIVAGTTLLQVILDLTPASSGEGPGALHQPDQLVHRRMAGTGIASGPKRVLEAHPSGHLLAALGAPGVVLSELGPLGGLGIDHPGRQIDLSCPRAAHPIPLIS
jgi:hypothetical protein